MSTHDDDPLRDGAAHDIRNALSTVAGWVALARSGRVPIDDALQAIALATDTASRTVDVLLDGSSGEEDACDLSQCLQDVARLLRPTAQERAVRIAVRAPRRVIAELPPSHASRIAWNLALNAVQALSSGEMVTLVAEQVGDRAVMRVEDQGPGMDRRTQLEILKHRHTRREGGRGIGLTAVRELVRAANGTMTLDSAPGRGTSFRIEFALTKRSRASSGVTNRAVRSVVVVEDDAGVRELVATTLSLRGLEVTTVDSQAAAARIEGRFDVALIDLTLADGSGRDVVADFAARKIVPRFVLMSGLPAPQELASHGWLRKPFDARQLLGALGVAAVDAAV